MNKSEPKNESAPKPLDQPKPPARSTAESLARALGLPESFLVDESLDAGADWVFAVKLHALMETAINQMIAKALDKQELGKFIARLPTSDEQMGKLAIIKAMELLPSDQQKLMKGFSMLRNQYAHDAAMLPLAIMDCIDPVRAEKAKDCIRFLRVHLGETRTHEAPEGKTSYTADEFVRQHPRAAIVFGVLVIALKSCHQELPYVIEFGSEAFVLNPQSIPHGMSESFTSIPSAVATTSKSPSYSPQASGRVSFVTAFTTVNLPACQVTDSLLL